jgi:hypothetical protein
MLLRYPFESVRIRPTFTLILVSATVFPEDRKMDGVESGSGPARFPNLRMLELTNAILPR